MRLVETYYGDCCGATRLSNETGHILLFGDSYHDKIEYMITGYLEALKDLDIDYELEERTAKCTFCDVTIKGGIE